MSEKYRLRTIFLAILIFLLPFSCLQAAQIAETASHYIKMKDGTRLAADVHLPVQRPAEARFPALIQVTRYWRASEDPETGTPHQPFNGLDRFFIENDYALVMVDARGSGASFGSRPVEYGPQEVRDGYDVVDWVVAQPWSNGRVGAYGTSYTGTTAELLAASEHPAVKAVIPGWSDFDIFASPARPYGLLASFIEDWGSMVAALDQNDHKMFGAAVRRVDIDTDGTLLDAALSEHENNPDVFVSVRDAEYRDAPLYGGITYEQIGPVYWRKAIERSDVPMLVLVSWLDAGTIEGALLRHNHFSNPQKLVIMASSHGGRNHASPFVVSGEQIAPVPSAEAQFKMRLDFFDHYLKGKNNGVEDWPAIRYFNMGREEFLETEEWPPPGSGSQAFFLREGNLLSNRPPESAGSADYQVDFSVTTGRFNRWRTQMGEPVLKLDNRGDMDARMLTFTSAPLERDLQITGTPAVAARVSIDRPDGVLLVYLEDVDGNGRSRYITEGGLRLIHRKVSRDPNFGVSRYHSFRRQDARPMVPGRVERVTLNLWATSVLIEKGHRLRVAIAGADSETLDRVPAKGDLRMSFHWSPNEPSVLELPVIKVK